MALFLLFPFRLPFLPVILLGGPCKLTQWVKGRARPPTDFWCILTQKKTHFSHLNVGAFESAFDREDACNNPPKNVKSHVFLICEKSKK